MLLQARRAFVGANERRLSLDLALRQFLRAPYPRTTESSQGVTLGDLDDGGCSFRHGRVWNHGAESWSRIGGEFCLTIMRVYFYMLKRENLTQSRSLNERISFPQVIQPAPGQRSELNPWHRGVLA